MIKAKRLQPGDLIAVVSLSWGGLGDPAFIHKYHIAKERLETEFGLRVMAMPHALKGTDFVANHPELRAKDLMNAFLDPDIKAVFCAIGGDDSIRLMPYIDYDIIKNNPKIFLGYSDTTIGHLMMYKAGLSSFYGPSVMCEFGAYVKMADYTMEAVKKLLFGDSQGYVMTSSPEWSAEQVPWKESNRNTANVFQEETHGHELLQGSKNVRGHLLGGCLDVFTMVIGTPVWPTLDQWKGAILFIETSEDKPSPDLVIYTLRNFAAQGILKELSGIVVGKPQGEVYYEAYKEAILEVVREEEKLTELPILYNMNFGHATPIGILPYGIQAELDCQNRTLRLLESATEE